jgi:bifunctional UDP-N-acetylglucosamine pyrophosphorylase/glucosamine-1-phosphate N-acetyltransferase
MLEHVYRLIASHDQSDNADTRVVISKNFNDHYTLAGNQHQYIIQQQQLGTGDAVRAAFDFDNADTVNNLDNKTIFVLYGDTPFITNNTLGTMEEQIKHNNAAVVVAGFVTANPHGYGRLINNTDNNLIAIVEDKDASPQQLQIKLCNAGIMAFSGRYIQALLSRLTNDNSQGEYYLTDCVAHAIDLGLICKSIEVDQQQVLGANTRADLAKLEQIFQQQQRQKFMADGVSMVEPDSVFIDADVTIEHDVLIEPNVIIKGKTHIATGSRIRAFSYLEDAIIGKANVIGPYARLRPQTKLASNVKIGNFVEVKKSIIYSGSKVNHLSYIGDSEVMKNVNIGAGTITCNYDGFNKHKTVLENDVFVGSNSAIVAPVRVAEGSIIGAGSVITEDTEKDDLAIARGRQQNLSGQAKLFRERRSDNKD